TMNSTKLVRYQPEAKKPNKIVDKISRSVVSWFGKLKTRTLTIFACFVAVVIRKGTGKLTQ
ncbi:hypothetical protein, partial [Salmonella sp. SAL4434]|uniref:hypothetical protein n=1 Tax=Salmonella sp. SAL4434 TaxID=3159889 RepID=UPI00397A4E7D